MTLAARLASAAAAVVTWLALASFTIVLDPGHGGRDHGCLGVSQREKDINLAVALKVRRLLEKEMPDAKIVMTRASDIFIPLQDRCNIANNAKGDIFVSIHTNSVGARNPRRSTVEGASVYTLGQRRSDTNLEVAMRENAVIKLEDDYSTTYSGFDPNSAESYIIFELSQSAHLDQSIRLAGEIQSELTSTAERKDMGVRQEPFWVLVRTSMPAVLVELDFVCNPAVESFLGSDKGRDSLARAIANGIKSYRGQRRASDAPDAKPAKKDKGKGKDKGKSKDKKHPDEASEPLDNEQPSNPAPEATGDVWRVQFLASDRPLHASDARLDGMDADCYVDGGLHKYVTGSYASQQEAQRALKTVRRRFADAFVVHFRDGVRIK